ncbi:ribonuclease H-like protein [Epithele typhae]|uniref:ribonuclease H-like protein n=1 Tax=Epithele typhae TaxID=378194 RepID=UPI002008C7F2|nr:ribonuclease H-like protein [Epithele typhae]KAH9944999.1 ribonuclease H-like protein [Epithele typhae]
MVAKDKAAAKSPSSNWLALQKKLPKSKTTEGGVSAFVARKRRKLAHASESPAPSFVDLATQPSSSLSSTHEFPRGEVEHAPGKASIKDEVKNGESVADLVKMVLGETEHPHPHHQPGKYLSLDCEMVGVGIDGSESALARVSLVNFYGHVLLDAIVRPRERVVDYRTEFSGIRPADMVNARQFVDVQKEAADLLKDRILVGHAVHNDLKALLLSHPRPLTRDTQLLAHKHNLMRGRRPALRHLVRQELGLTIQGGEHSSVTDARATMAVFRLHRKTWEKGLRAPPPPKSPPPSSAARKRTRSESEGDDDEEEGEDAEAAPPLDQKDGRTGKKTRESFPGGGRKRVSSGLSTVVKRIGGTGKDGDRGRGKPKAKDKWWKELGRGSKGGIRLPV